MKMTLAEPKLKFLPAGAIFWLVREGLREGPTIFVDHPDRFTNVSRSSPVAGVHVRDRYYRLVSSRD
jgi:hypothetical protein